MISRQKKTCDIDIVKIAAHEELLKHNYEPSINKIIEKYCKISDNKATKKQKNILSRICIFSETSFDKISYTCRSACEIRSYMFTKSFRVNVDITY